MHCRDVDEESLIVIGGRRCEKAPPMALLLLLALALGAAGAATPDVSVAIDWNRPVANSSTAVRPHSASA
jgi:hypothetical protein